MVNKKSRSSRRRVSKKSFRSSRRRRVNTSRKGRRYRYKMDGDEDLDQNWLFNRLLLDIYMLFEFYGVDVNRDIFKRSLKKFEKTTGNPILIAQNNAARAAEHEADGDVFGEDLLERLNALRLPDPEDLP